MTALVLLPIAVGLMLTGAGLAWPLAKRAGREAEREEARMTAPLPAPRAELEGGYEGLHRWGRATGCATQVRALAALREPTQDLAREFLGIVAANYGAGEVEALAWRCDSCRRLVEFEKAHASCGGCGCPCTVVEPVLIGRPPLGVGA